MPNYLIATNNLSKTFYAQWRPITKCYHLWQITSKGYFWVTACDTIGLCCEYIRTFEQLSTIEKIEI